MVGPPYQGVVRLLTYADANWVALDAEYPTVDLIRLPWRKFLNILYMSNVKAWAHQQRELRGEAGPDPTFDEFDYLLNAGLPGGSKPEDDQDFMSDYT